MANITQELEFKVDTSGLKESIALLEDLKKLVQELEDKGIRIQMDNSLELTTKD